MTNREETLPILDGVGEVTVDPALVGVVVDCDTDVGSCDKEV
jgi:hypothetical protein